MVSLVNKPRMVKLVKFVKNQNGILELFAFSIPARSSDTFDNAKYNSYLPLDHPNQGNQELAHIMLGWSKSPVSEPAAMRHFMEGTIYPNTPPTALSYIKGD